MLARSEFETASRTLVGRDGWEWKDEHPYGYLQRTKEYAGVARSQDNSLDDMVGEEEDAATASVPSSPTISQQYIVYSATFQVPAFYFTLHDTSWL